METIFDRTYVATDAGRPFAFGDLLEVLTAFNARVDSYLSDDVKADVKLWECSECFDGTVGNR